MKTSIQSNVQFAIPNKASKLISILFIVCVAIIIGSCKKKEETYTFKGIVTETANGNPLSGCVVTLLSTSISNGSYGSGFSTIGTTTTNASGAYSFEIPVEKTIKFKLTTNKSNYFRYELEFDMNSIQNNISTNNITLDPEATITIAAKNTMPFDGNDKITFKYKGSTKACAECCTNDVTTYTGTMVNDSITCKIIGNTMAVIEYVSQKNNMPQIHLDSVYCPSFQKSRYQINF
ncbi:MAG: hypothetical protein WCK02_00360 [Bacteroidota bacterium]